jgi:hypothetical protein
MPPANDLERREDQRLVMLRSPLDDLAGGIFRGLGVCRAIQPHQGYPLIRERREGGFLPLPGLGTVLVE